MKIECDVCGRAEASVFCCADEAALCAGCDSKVHKANKLAGKHSRLSIFHSQPDFPTCDICQEKRAFFFCREDRALLCRDCDFSVHSATDLTAKHARFLVPGIKVPLHPIMDTLPPPPPPLSSSSSNSRATNNEKEIGMASNKTEEKWIHKTNPLTDLPIFPPKPANVNQGGPDRAANINEGAPSRADISQYLTEVEEFLASSSPARLDCFATDNSSKCASEDVGKTLAVVWAADVGLGVPDLTCNFYRDSMAEVPETETETEMPSFSQQETCIYSRHGIMMKPPVAHPFFTTGDDTFMVPDVPLASITSSKRLRPFWDV